MKNTNILGNNLEFLYLKSSFFLVRLFQWSFHKIHTRTVWRINLLHSPKRSKYLTRVPIWDATDLKLSETQFQARLYLFRCTAVATWPPNTSAPIRALTGLPSPALTSDTYFCHVTSYRRLSVLMFCFITKYSEGPATGHLDTGFSRFPCL